MSELVEWLVGCRDRTGTLRTIGEGAQSIFSLTRAQRLAKNKGEPWQALHQRTHLPPDDHELYVKEPARACPTCLQKGLYAAVPEDKGHCPRCYWQPASTARKLRDVWGSMRN